MITGIPYLLAETGDPAQLLEHLESTLFDELLEIDLNNGTFRSIYHVEDKYRVPLLEGDYLDFYNYTAAHTVLIDDRDEYLRFLDPDTMQYRLDNAPTKGFLGANLRIKVVSGGWIWTNQYLIGGEEYGLPKGIVRIYIFDVHILTQRFNGQKLFATSVSRHHVYDELTGLLQERDFFSIARERLHSIPDDWCVVDVDIEQYKLFIDWFGKDGANYLLALTGEKMHAYADLCGGLAGYRGGDHFCMLIPYDMEDIKALQQELQEISSSISKMDGFSPLFGICVIEDRDADILEIYNRAALATEDAIDDVSIKIAVYDNDLRKKNEEEYRLINEFRHAIEHGEIFIDLQPQCRISNRKVVGAEALVRWRTKDGKNISPAVFIPILEKFNVVTEMDKYVWNCVGSWIRSWIDRGHDWLPVSINISRLDILSMNVPEYLDMLVKKYDIPAAALKVEITESAYVHSSEPIQEAIDKLRALGFMVLMDDFGSGYSSLNMLGSIKVDVIKLDAQFLHLNGKGQTKSIGILESVISMAQNLSTPIIVEGVETKEQADFIENLGCNYLQGFYFHKPMSVEGYEALISDSKNVDKDGFILSNNRQLHVREFMDENIYSDSMLNNILGPVVFYNLKDGKITITRYNQQFFKMLGVGEDEIDERCQHVLDVLYPDDRNKLLGLLEKAEADPFNGGQGIVRTRKTSSIIMWISLKVFYLSEDEKGKKFYASMTDVTELQYINADLPGGYMRCANDDDFTMLYISDNFTKLTGFSKEEIQTEFDNKFVSMIHPDDRAQVAAQSAEILEGRSNTYNSYRIRRKEGDYFYVADQSNPTDKFGSICWQCMLLDIDSILKNSPLK